MSDKHDDQYTEMLAALTLMEDNGMVPLAVAKRFLQKQHEAYSKLKAEYERVNSAYSASLWENDR